MSPTKHKIIGLAFSVSILALSACTNDCGDPGYVAGFYVTDKKTGKPYFDVNKVSPDSVRVFINSMSGSPMPMLKNYDAKNGYIFADIYIYGDEQDTLYIYFNRLDTDTLIISNKITHVSGKCNSYTFLTTGIYNGLLLEPISSDSTGSFVKFNLIK